MRTVGLLASLAAMAAVLTVGLHRAQTGAVAILGERGATVAAAGVGAPAAEPRAPVEAGPDEGERPDDLGFTDELLQTPMLGHPDFVREVRRWVDFWESAPAEWFPDYLERMAAFSVIVDTTLAAHDLPWSLRFLPVIESGYSPTAVSSASAVGMWQFMAHTAQDFDIEVGHLVDGRRDPYVSTAAAADFLVQLREDFGSWFLALAAYNAGPQRIRGIMERHAPDVEPSDALYWALRPYMPKETADFVPNLFGAIIVASDPEGHGYRAPEPRVFSFDRVPVRGQLSFERAAEAAGTSADEIARLNPQYVRGVTPSDEIVDLRLPEGRGAAFREYFAGKAAGGS